jgi:hypothetical protein
MCAFPTLQPRNIKPIIIEYINGKAYRSITKKDPLSDLICPGEVNLLITLDFMNKLCVGTYKQSSDSMHSTVGLLISASDIDIKLYNQINQETFERFADYIIEKINAGYFNEQLKCLEGDKTFSNYCCIVS